MTDLNIMNAVINYKIPASSVGSFLKLEAAGSNLGTCSYFLFCNYYYSKLLLFGGLLTARS